MVSTNMRCGFKSFIGSFYAIVLFVLLCCVSGCVSHQYKVILRNNQVIPARTRPKLDEATATYTFKDRSGRRVTLPAQMIREIEIY